MEQLTVVEAAQSKGCSGQAIRDAIKKGVIDADVFGKTYVVKVNAKYKQWAPSTDKQAAGKARAKKAKRKTRR